MEKQTTGFCLGKYRVKVLKTLGEVHHQGRTYKLVSVEVEGGANYYSLRLYNAKGHFIKQLMIEPEILGEIGTLFLEEAKLTWPELLRRFPHLIKN